MKKLVSIMLILISQLSFGAPCDGAQGKAHTNPDTSPGGFVANTARVSKTVVLDSSSSVCEKAMVLGNVKIKSSSVVAGNAKLEGNASLFSSTVKGQANVLGNSSIVNSSVCQASEINFNVMNSDYYCQTDDPEPKDPGELGKKTVNGIDSDADGVRDDVEIWINNNTSNTPQKNMYNLRMALKQAAKNIQGSIKYSQNREISREYSLKFINSSKCLKSVLDDKGLIGTPDLQVVIFNTIDRIKTWAKIQGNLNGTIISIDGESGEKFCNFKII